jgi:undecaprenyl pyrophosphate phosphatase UppP
MGNFLNSARGRVIVAVAMATGALALPSLAGATAYDPTSDATSLATSAGTIAGPVVAAVFGAVIGLLVLFWAVRFVKRIIH